MVLIIYETILIIEENPELLTISLLILSNPYLSERTGNWLGDNSQSLFPVL